MTTKRQLEQELAQLRREIRALQWRKFRLLAELGLMRFFLPYDP